MKDERRNNSTLSAYNSKIKTSRMAKNIILVRFLSSLACLLPLIPSLRNGSGPDDRDPNAYRALIIPMALSAIIAAITSCLIVFVENSGRSLSTRVRLIKRSIWSMLYGSTVLYVAMMCIGVGFPQRIVLSWLVCILLSSFVVVPLSMTSRRPTWYVHDLWSFSPQLCCLGGAWLGAVPISLDWNVPWLRWPLPVALGGMIGHLLSCLVVWVVDLFY